MLVHFLAVLLTSCFWLVADAMSKVYWLPDYQANDLHKKGYQDRGQSNAQNSVSRGNAFGCAAYGYLEEEVVDRPENCEKKFQLADGRFCYLDCCEKAPDDYTLYSIPSNASYSHFYDECEEKDKYRLDSCNTNYYLSVDECKACTWNNYTLTEKNVSNAADYYSDTCGGVTKYAIKSCNSGYEINGNVCQACTWNNYTLTSKNVSHAATYYSSTCGGVTKYAVKTCDSCYYRSGNNCYEESCDTVDCSHGSCSTDSCGCQVLDDCDSGYEMSGNSCIACTWDNYTLTSKNVSNAATYYSSTCDGTTKYAVKTCNTCYYKSGNSCIEESCDMSTCPSNGSCSTDSCGCKTLTSCDSGYEKSGNSCIECTWSGYTLTSKNVDYAASYYSSTCDGTTKYAVKTCEECHYKNGDSCPFDTCDSVDCTNATCSTDSCGCDVFEYCDDCYHKSGNSCVKDSCDSVDCDNATCSTDSCGCDVFEYCDDCYSRVSGVCKKDTCSYTCTANATCTTDSCGCDVFVECDDGYEGDKNGCESKCPTSCDKTCPNNSECSYDSCGCRTSIDGCDNYHYSSTSECGDLSDYGRVYIAWPDSNGCGDCAVECESPYAYSCPNGFDCAVVGAGACYRVNGCADDYYDCEGCCVPHSLLGYDMDCSRVDVSGGEFGCY